MIVGVSLIRSPSLSKITAIDNIFKHFVVTSDPLLRTRKWEKHKYIAASLDTDISEILNEGGLQNAFSRVE